MNVFSKSLAGLTLATVLAGAPSLAAAGAYDGSRPILCVVTTIMECGTSGYCERQIADGVNSPAFIKVDVPGKVVTAEGTKRSQLKSVARVDGELILQGSENGRGWSATIDEETGRMAVAVVDSDYTFSLFGACTIP